MKAEKREKEKATFTLPASTAGTRCHLQRRWRGTEKRRLRSFLDIANLLRLRRGINHYLFRREQTRINRDSSY